MRYFWINTRLKIFKLRWWMAGKLSKFFETLKDHLNPQRNPKLFNFLKRISNFFKKRTRAIVHNKNDWMERIQRGNEFAVHEDD